MAGRARRKQRYGERRPAVTEPATPLVDRPPLWRSALGKAATAALAFFLGIAATVTTTYLSNRVAKATQPEVRMVGQVWGAGAYYFRQDPGLARLTDGQPVMQPKPAVVEDYYDRLDRHLRDRGAVPGSRMITLTVINRQSEPVTVTGVWAQVTRREKVEFAAWAGDESGGGRDTTLHFDMSRDRPAGVLECGADGCEISPEAVEIQQQGSYFAADPLNIPASETRSFNAYLDGDNLDVTFHFVITLVALDARGDRTQQEIPVRDAGDRDFHGVTGDTRGRTFYVIDFVNGEIKGTS
ncbi:hypothetical protein JIG36_12890 [Actinoplanes sp. LDG1-06]|uniref:Uncharacterized protein n=1 Tax=Paractinoplanes ovalisporus TaxID=2810368 RepID=A0ABS2A9E6_9ACTN|nr:hypothetical protein [Actinoplanes ovalisporus]MBM2616454.1 hypothetical protein [Actinoplanes ovalisporus]